ncbi:hypothetical protein AGMMS49982_15910 [Bacteroidia bacterium]|nr:hypothetical protein AGMMS49982_15910 [Bacteroidia bacterium]
MVTKKRKKLGRFMNLTTDYGFKTAFGVKHERLLINFVNGVFEGRKKIVSIKHLQLKQLGSIPKDRDAIYDLYCMDEDGAHYIIEMQVAPQKHFLERCLFYAAASILAQAPKGRWDYEMKPLYVISILNFVLNKDNTDCINYYSLMNEKTLTKVSDGLQLITIELPKFNKLLTELQSDLDKWLFCIKHQSELSEQPAELKGEIFDELFEITDLNTLTEEDMKTYEEFYKGCYGFELAADYAREQGVEQGIQQGIQQGVQKGVQQTTYEIAQKCIQEGMALDLVIRITGLSPEELKSIGLK